MDCIIPIFEYLMDEHIFYIRHVENVHNLLMQSMIQNEGLMDCAKCCIRSFINRSLFSQKKGFPWQVVSGLLSLDIKT